jgi:hypothetical protein
MENYLEEARGWPCFALSQATIFTDETARRTRGIGYWTTVNSFVVGHYPKARVRPGGVPKSLPLRPLWPGFAINTMFYAAILWLLIFAPFTLRRWRRMRRGLCAACAYPVGSSSVCTESGKPFPGPRVTTAKT